MSRRRANLKSGNDSFICEVSRVMVRDDAITKFDIAQRWSNRKL
jgi:hypothetical protein